MEFEPLSNTLDIPILPTIDDIYFQEIIQKDNLNSEQAEERLNYIIENTSQAALENNSKIPTEDELLNELTTRINPNIIFTNISKNVKYGSIGGFNTVRFHNINGTNITYRESKEWIFKYYSSESGELSSDVSVQNDVLDDFIDDNNTENTDDYVKLNAMFNKTIENNINASNRAIAPQLYFAGFIKKEVSDGLEFYFVIINETFTTNLHEYYRNSNYKGYYDRLTNKLEDDDIFIRNSLFELLKNTVEKLNIICFDVKPGNCVLNLNEKGEITNIRLIDWDANYCIHDRNLENNEDAQNTVFSINLIFMSIHFLLYLDYNIFFKMKMNSESIYNAQQYICEHRIYGPIYKMLMKNYFGADYNDRDIEKCKNIVLELIEYSNTLLKKTKGGKKIVKKIFKQKTNKKTRKNRSTKNKTKKGGRMENPNPNNHNTILEELSIEQPRIFSAEYQSIMNIIDMPNLDSNSFSQPFIKLYFILYDNLQKESIVEQLDDDELNIIFLQFILLFCHNEMTDNEKRRVREFFLQNDDDYSVVLKLNDDQRDIEMQHKFPDRIIEKLHEKRDLFASYLES
jgi:hypothetical protein